MSLTVWMNEKGKWESLDDEVFECIPSSYMVSDIIISNTEIETCVTELLSTYIKKCPSVDSRHRNIEEISYRDKVDFLKNILNLQEKSSINSYLLEFLDDISTANKFRDRTAHRNIYRELLKDAFIKHLKQSGNNLLLRSSQFVDDVELNNRDNKANIRDIFNKFNRLVEKHINIVGLLQQGAAECIVDESLGISDNTTIGDALLNGKKKIRVDGKPIKVSEWSAPPFQEGPDARILTMPNIPQPLQGYGMQPRTIEGKDRWDEMRHKCYLDAHYRCQACGRSVSSPGEAQAHEMFSFDFDAKEAKFERLVCLCDECHKFIHSGRSITAFKRDTGMKKDELLSIIRHGFELIRNYNLRNKETLLAYATISESLKSDSIGEEVQRMVCDYDISFYSQTSSKGEGWSQWKMFYKGKEYATPYKDHNQYNNAMKKQHKGEQNV